MVRVDEAMERDVIALARLRAATWGTEGYWRERINTYLRREVRAVYVAWDADAVVGFIAGHLTTRFSCDGELEWLDVAESHQRRRIASTLFHRLATWFATQHAVRICVDVDPGNFAAQAFYRRHGAEDLRRHWLVWPDIRIPAASVTFARE